MIQCTLLKHAQEWFNKKGTTSGDRKGYSVVVKANYKRLL